VISYKQTDRWDKNSHSPSEK